MQVKRSYWSYLYHSKGRHGIHSPFVFELMDTCLTAKMDKNFSGAFKKWSKDLRKSRQLLEFNDFGAGCKTGIKRLRSVKSIYLSSSTRGVYGRFLHRLARYYEPQKILELGTSLGVGTFHLLTGSLQSHMTTVEGCASVFHLANEQRTLQQKERTLAFHGSFLDYFASLNDQEVFDMVYLDGHHDGSATLRYLTLLVPHLHENSLVVIDDIRWSKDMWAAWKQVALDTRFHLTMDFGRMGIVALRKQQQKEHFILRPVVFRTPWF